VQALGRLKATSVHGEYYARNHCERLAKAWANGEHGPTFRKLAQGEEYPLWEKRQNELKATGLSVEGALNDLEACFYITRDLPRQLMDSCEKAGYPGQLFVSFGKAEAQEFSNSYASVCDF
jgi:hypothetical protein